MGRKQKADSPDPKSPITWALQEVRAGDLKANPKNPKKKDGKGMERLKKSLSKFGVVFDGIANKDFTVIDGHSRLELTANPEKQLMYFLPSRQLTKEEYEEMNAMYDHAKAGTTDMQIVEEIFTEEQLTEWNIKPKVAAQADDYESRYEVVVECSDEKDQEKVFNLLTQEGYKCRILQL